MEIVEAALLQVADAALLEGPEIIAFVGLLIFAFLAGVAVGLWVIPWLVDHDLFPGVRVSHDRR